MTGFPRRYIGSKQVDVYFNGTKCGSIPKGSTETIVLTSGGQVDFVTNYMGKDRRQSFNIPSGITADLYFDFGPLGGLKVVEQGSGSTTFVGYMIDLP